MYPTGCFGLAGAPGIILTVLLLWKVREERVFLNAKTKIYGISSISCVPASAIICYVVQVPGGSSLEPMTGETVPFSMGYGHKGGRKR